MEGRFFLGRLLHEKEERKTLIRILMSFLAFGLCYLIVKDHALILIASLLLGIFFLMSADHCMLQFHSSKGSRFGRFRYGFRVICFYRCSV